MNQDKLEKEILKRKIALLEKEAQDKELLPHKYYDLYDWQHEFIECTHHKQYLTAANQTGKTFSMMLKAFKMSADVEWREKQWGDNQPRMGWYILPDQKTIDDNFYTKWEPDILPRGEKKKKGKYRWQLVKSGGHVRGIYFPETQFTLSFVSFGASASNLQSRTLGFVIFDEEPKELHKIAEIETRTLAYNDPVTGDPVSIIVYGFTPTIGHDRFRRIFSFNDPNFFNNIPEDIKEKYFEDGYLVNPRNEKDEIEKKSKLIWKRRVSMFDCIKFRSGKPGRLTVSRIRQFIQAQPNARSIMIRVFGSFEKDDDGGLVYSAFNRMIHLQPYHDVFHHENVNTGFYTAGIDYGSGTNHQSSIVISWISPDYKAVRIYKMWKGAKGVPTTADDVIKKYVEMTRGIQIKFPFYDWAAADLREIAFRMGITLHKAQKNVELGTNLMNTLFKNNMIKILVRPGDDMPHHLALELENITHDQKKRSRNDDLSDSLKYSLSGIAHLFNLLELNPDYKAPIEQKMVVEPEYKRRDWQPDLSGKKHEWTGEIEDEINEWSEYY
ncbi:MAG: hypothetical protein N4A33_04785 [Bacteriovoracaceae bacterium]|jgi:phage terminase large subunit-like protein|nr:hypothetical protein [Bacteriovoracaceae bacterium]